MVTTADMPPAQTAIDLPALRAIVDRTAAVLSPNDHEQLLGAVQQLVELHRLVRERGTTIARLRRLFHLAASEKTEHVLDNDSTAAPPPDEGSSSNDKTDDDGKPTDTAPARGKGKNKGRNPASAYKGATRHQVDHPDLRSGAMCPACAAAKLYEKAPVEVIRLKGRPPVDADCWACQRLRCAGCGEVFVAPAPESAQGDKYTPSAAAMIAVLHYGAGVPFHLLEKLQANMQIPLPSSTQWDIMKARAPTFAPVFGHLSKLAAQSDLIHTDDTSVRVLEFMGKRRRDLLNAGKLDDPERTGLFTTGMLGRTPEGQSIAVFASGRRHAGENLAQLLEGRAKDLEPPIHVCDALSRNVPVGHTVVEANCNAHARRNIIDETKNFPDECRTILEALREVFKNDKIAQRDRLSDDDRLRLHQCHSGPVLGRLRRWMRQQFRERRIEENSGLGSAIRYILRHWKKLTLFLRRAGVPLTNNIIERALKMTIRYRRNSLFYRNENGAEVGDMYMSLIHTAHLNGVNPVDYLTKLQAHADKVAERPDDWMPWNYRATIDKGTGPPPAPAT